ncbi:MAG: flagellar hook-associated protein FlgK [SAR324 cluster bacterium]|nr:flagellar hook-associated protein FlgK [SAR324 cluster bacterium]
MSSSGSLFSQLDLGKRALMAQQAGMNVAGHNIANINNEDFSRQRVQLEDQHPRKSMFGQGVNIGSVERVTDRFATQRVIAEQARLGGLSVREQTLAKLEQIFNEMETGGLRATLNEFWDAWGHLANQPESEIHRSELITKTRSMTRKLNEMGGQLRGLRTEVNGRMSLQIEQINQLAEQLAVQNTNVQRTDRGRGEASDLRDEREATLKKISKLIEINWFEDDDKLIQVTAGNGWPLVAGRRAGRLEASLKNNELGMFSLHGIDPQGISKDLTGEIREGEMAEMFRLRDETILGFVKRLDEFTTEMAYKINRLHSSGTGINSSTDSLRSSFSLKPDAQVKPLPFLRDGIFRIHLVTEDNEILETYEVELEAGRDTIRDIVDRINATVGESGLFGATLNSDGSVTLASNGVYNFIIGDDETEFSVLMGFNNFLETLRGATDITINEGLVRKSNTISTGKDLVPGDNSVALAIHDLQFKPTMQGDSITFDEFYNGMLAELGLIVQRSQTDKRNQQVIVDQFQKLRNEISSVNMDEEVADMVQFQRGFDAAAKFITTIDEMTRTIIDM